MFHQNRKSGLFIFVLFLSCFFMLSAKEVEKSQFVLKLEPGKIYKLSNKDILVSEILLPGQKMSENKFIENKYWAKVIALTDQEYLIHLGFEDFFISEATLLNNQNADDISIQAAARILRNFKDEAISLFSNEIGNLYVDIDLSTTGELLRFGGKESFLDSAEAIIFSRLSKNDYNSKKEGKKGVKLICLELVNEVEKTFQHLFDYIPKESVSQGAKWSSELSLPGTGKIKIDYMYDRVQNENYFISFSGEVFMDELMSLFKIPLMGWSQGFIVIDKNTGWVVSSRNVAQVNLSRIVKLDEMDFPLNISLLVIKEN